MFDLDRFLGSDDLEAAQYRLLAAMQTVHAAYHQGAIYPYLGELIRLRRELDDVLESSEALKQQLPRRIEGVDWEEGAVRYEDAAPLPARVEELAAWALPRLADAIEEGRTIFEFVEREAELETVGLLPAYQGEGYLVYRDPETGAFRAVRYTASVLTGEHGRYRSLRTSALEQDGLDAATATAYKEALVEAYPDLPHPATFWVRTDLEFPVEATVLPVAKRMLLRFLTQGDVGIA